MNNVVKIMICIGLSTMLAGCSEYTSTFTSNRGYFDINGASSNVDISNAISASFDSSDQERVGHALSTTRNNIPFAWQNKVTGNNYKLLPTRTFIDDQGQPCRYYYLTGILRGHAMTMRATACRVAGTWQMTN